MTQESVQSAQLDALIDEAVVDCYDESECVMGFHTMLDDNLQVPFRTTVLGVEVTVEEVDLSGDGIVAVCRRGTSSQRIPIAELPLPTPEPAGAEWIHAYRKWLG